MSAHSPGSQLHVGMLIAAIRLYLRTLCRVEALPYIYILKLAELISHVLIR